MAATPSRMVPLGTPAPDFTLPDPRAGRTVSLADVRGEKGTVVMFICNHCPFVQLVADELARLGRDYADRGIGFVAISANDAVTHPDDAPEKMAAEAKARGYDFPYLFDETQEVARAYAAECTPDFFAYGPDGALAYRGQLDDARPGNGIEVDGADLRAALDALVAGTPVSGDQKPAMGCNIKWRA